MISLNSRSGMIPALLIFLAGCILGGTIVYLVPQSGTLYTDIIVNKNDVRSKGYGQQFTNPLLECTELAEGISIGQRVNLHKEVGERITAAQAKGTLSDAAVYYRDLNNGPWFGIHEEREYYPASLLKLPLAISYYNRAETDPEILSATFEYQAGADIEAEQAFRSDKKLVNGAPYSVQDLIAFMLQESSNEAAALLFQLASPAQITGVYADLGIPEPKTNADYEINVHTFSSFFRILFNATYLDRVASERILESMTHSSFTQGIVAGVPAGMPVAHKYGTREIESEGLKQLHDCGIVYAPDKPYILCVMTEGKDFNELAAFIKEISALVYREVSA